MSLRLKEQDAVWTRRGSFLVEIQTIDLSTIHGTIYTSSIFTASEIFVRGIGVG